MEQREDWYRARRYLQFDRPCSRETARRIVENPERVASNSFHPFIGVDQKIPRYKRLINEVEIKVRSISFASHVDSHIYAYYSQLISECLEFYYKQSSLNLNDAVIAYRKLRRSNVHFAKEIFDEIGKRQECEVLTFDVSGFFDNLDHQLLKVKWCEILGLSELPLDHYKVFRSLTRHSRIMREDILSTLDLDLHDLKRLQRNSRPICTTEEFRSELRNLIIINENNHGIPQGSPISAVLSNLYMCDFDARMVHLADSIGGIYRRYSDDIAFVIPIGYANIVEDEFQSALDAVKLVSNKDKTTRSVFRRNVDGELSCDVTLQYLGFTFDGKNILIRPQSIGRYHRKLRKRIKAEYFRALANESVVIRRKDIYKRYSHLGRKNFIRYVINANKIMKSRGIKRQIRKHMNFIDREVCRQEARLTQQNI